MLVDIVIELVLACGKTLTALCSLAQLNNSVVWVMAVVNVFG